MTNITLGSRVIGVGQEPFIIAEIGINHEGSIDKAIQMIDDAANAGGECVKFQCHILEEEMIENHVVPGNAKEPIWHIIKRCQLTEKQEFLLKQYTESKGLIFLSTPFSRAAVDRLEKMGVLAYKIGSGECNNYPLIRYIASLKKPIFLSTGMNDINAIKRAVNILRHEKINFCILHCTSVYPTPPNLIRLNAIHELRNLFTDAVVGYSDHSLSNLACLGAISLGASVIERHFTTSKKWLGPDINISMNPEELRELIKDSKELYECLQGGKNILEEEKLTINFAYASIVSTKSIKKGEYFSSHNIWPKRPGTGEFKAKDYDELLGKQAATDIPKNTQICAKHIL